jgi:DNA-directed RNA polymerase specialized sigma24 family protein
MPREDKPSFQNYKMMIAKKAWKYSTMYTIEFEELVCEGNLIFVKATKAFNNNGTKFSTFLWRCLENGLSSFCKQERRQMFFEYSEDGELPDGCNDDHLMIKKSIDIRQSIARLSVHSQVVMRLLIERPHELGLTGQEPPRVIRGTIKRHFRQQGHSWAVTWQMLREIRNVYQEV